MAIEKGDLTPFDRIFFIADTLLTKGENGGNIFVSENKRRVLNPDYYQQLAQTIYPILNSNKKGFFCNSHRKGGGALNRLFKSHFPGSGVFTLSLQENERRKKRH